MYILVSASDNWKKVLRRSHFEYFVGIKSGYMLYRFFLFYQQIKPFHKMDSMLFKQERVFFPSKERCISSGTCQQKVEEEFRILRG